MTADPRPLLVIEDDAEARRQLRWTFDDMEVTAVGDRESGLARHRAASFPVVLLDLGLPPDAEGATEGLAALREILAIAPDVKVIVVTGREERETAIEAVRLGAWDYIQKPAEPEELRVLVNRAFRLHALERENRREARSAADGNLPGVVGTSEVIRRASELVERAAGSAIRVLFIGESGSGKEVLARALHERSPRAAGPFVAINSAAIPGPLLESELFGHERGAFTGAHRSAPGRIELADGGTLLLDEIGDMPLELQVKLLRFLEDGVIQRVGGRRDIAVDVRIVAATHRALREEIAEGRFREDLYFRLAELVVPVPPLRERPEDAVLLAEHLFARHRDDAPDPLVGFAAGALSAIARHPWPGNVRELENRVKSAVLMARGPRVSAADLELATAETLIDEGGTLKEALQDVERRMLERTWAEEQGNVSRVARRLGISRPTVYKLLKEHGLRD
jgi:two-component system NtrC family response regulator